MALCPCSDLLLERYIIIISFAAKMAFNLEDGGEDGVTSSLLSKESSEMEYGSFSEEVGVIGSLQKRVSFHNISYEVSQRSCCKKLLPKTILHNVR